MATGLRILHAVPRGGPGGAQLLATRLAAHQRSQGHDVHVASGPPPLAWDELVHPLPRLEREPRRVLPARAALARLLDDLRPDLVHCHGIGLGLALSLATRRGRRTPGCTTVHGLQPGEPRRAAPVLRAAGLPVVTVSPVLEEALRSHRVRDVRTIENGIPAVTPVDRAEVARRFPSLPVDLPLVVSAGRLVPDKRHLELVHAMARLAGVGLLVLGRGPSSAALAATVDALDLGDRVVLGGWQPDAAALVGAADLAVQPSNTEGGLSLSALEALQARVPLVAGNSPTFHAALRDGEDALLVDGASPDALAEAIRAVLDDPALAARLVAGGAQVAARHTIQGMAVAYGRLYGELVRG